MSRRVLPFPSLLTWCGRLLLAWGAVSLLPALSGAAPTAAPSATARAALAPAAAPLPLVVTHPVLEELARTLGGEAVVVTSLLPPGVDPHTFNPSPADVRHLARARLIVAAGFALEPYLERLVKNAGTSARVVQAGSAIRQPVRGLCRHPGHDHASAAHEGEDFDPHWWHSVAEVRAVTAWLATELERLLPARRTAIAAARERYEQRLTALAAWADSEIARLPAARRHLVTSHDAFGYFARDYGFTRLSLLSSNPEAEPEARALAGLIDRLRRDRIPAVFTDRAENPQVLATMVRESGARLGGTLYADGPGGPGTPAPDFEGMFRHNVRTIVTALSAPPPPSP